LPNALLFSLNEKFSFELMLFLPYVYDSTDMATLRIAIEIRL
jgi:hypothetical protein